MSIGQNAICRARCCLRLQKRMMSKWLELDVSCFPVTGLDDSSGLNGMLWTVVTTMMLSSACQSGKLFLRLSFLLPAIEISSGSILGRKLWLYLLEKKKIQMRQITDKLPIVSKHENTFINIEQAWNDMIGINLQNQQLGTWWDKCYLYVGTLRSH